MVRLRYPDQEICVVSHFGQYTEKTKDFRKDQNLLISFVLLNPTHALRHQPTLGGA